MPWLNIKRITLRGCTTEGIITEDVDIPVDEGNVLLKGTIHSSDSTPSQAPFILNLPGLLDDRTSYFVQYYTERFARAGYYVLAWDYRAHGETAEQTGKNWIKQLPEIFADLNRVIDWLLSSQSDKLLDEKIALFGRSLGGAIILTRGYRDPRARVLIPLCTRYDYGKFKLKFPPELVKQISAKYFLEKKPSNNDRILTAHCHDDKQIPFENLTLIVDHLGLSKENVIIYDKGGHSFKGHREEIFRHALDFLQRL